VPAGNPWIKKMGWGNSEWPKETVLSLELTLKAMNAALAKCDEGGYRLSVVVTVVGILRPFFVEMG
jgi:hypothetical protein